MRVRVGCGVQLEGKLLAQTITGSGDKGPGRRRARLEPLHPPPEWPGEEADETEDEAHKHESPKEDEEGERPPHCADKG